MTKKEIILETVEYYKTNNRGKDDVCCVYYDDNTKAMCAVGRCLDDAKEFQSKYGGGAVYEYDDVLENKLKSEYKNHSIEFWTQLQKLHDEDDNWEKTKKGNKLTIQGKKKLKEILSFYEE